MINPISNDRQVPVYTNNSIDILPPDNSPEAVAARDKLRAQISDTVDISEKARLMREFFSHPGVEPGNSQYSETAGQASKFSGRELDGAIFEGIAGFVNETLGDKELAKNVISRLANSSDFMAEMSSIIKEVHNKHGYGATKAFTDYLNGSVKDSINSTRAVIHDSIFNDGDLINAVSQFKGWRLNSPPEERDPGDLHTPYDLTEHWLAETVDGANQSRIIGHHFSNKSSVVTDWGSSWEAFGSEWKLTDGLDHVPDSLWKVNDDTDTPE